MRVLGGSPFAKRLTNSDSLSIIIEYHAPIACKFVSVTFEGYHEAGSRWYDTECFKVRCGPRARRFFILSENIPIGGSGYDRITSVAAGRESTVAQLDGFVSCYAVLEFNDGRFGGSSQEIAVGAPCARGASPGQQVLLPSENTPTDAIPNDYVITREGVSLDPTQIQVREQSLDGPCNESSVQLGGESPIGREYHTGDKISITVKVAAPAGCTSIDAWFFGYYPPDSLTYIEACATNCGPYVQRDFFGGQVKIGPDTAFENLADITATLQPPNGEIVGPRVGKSLDGFVLCYALVAVRGEAESRYEAFIGSAC